MTPMTAQPRMVSARWRWINPEQVLTFLLDDAKVNWPGGEGPGDVRIERVWPVVDDALAVEWSFQLGDQGRYSLYVTPIRPQDASVADIREPVVGCGVLQGLRLALPEAGLVIHSPDFDPGLPHLRACLNPAVMTDRLAGFCTNRGTVEADPSRREVELLSYRARRRAALKYRMNGVSVFGKTFRDGRGERAIRWHYDLKDRLFRASAGRVTVADPIGYLPDLRLALFSWCESDRALSRAHATPSDLRLAMNALGSLHRTPIDDAPAFSVSDEIGILERWQSALAKADPETADLLDRLVPVWRNQATPVDGCATIHRDFYDRQVLLGKNQTILVDIDTLSRGDPAVDVGTFLAHLWLDVLAQSGDSSGPAFESHARHVLIFYQESGGRLCRRSLRWSWASALLRLGAVHALRTTTGPFAVGLWRLAADVLDLSVSEHRLLPNAHLDFVPDVTSVLAEVEE